MTAPTPDPPMQVFHNFDITFAYRCGMDLKYGIVSKVTLPIIPISSRFGNIFVRDFARMHRDFAIRAPRAWLIIGSMHTVCMF
jgi:hypothetical protein